MQTKFAGRRKSQCFCYEPKVLLGQVLACIKINNSFIFAEKQQGV